MLQVTLHNSALFSMDADPTGGFRKLSHLLQSPPFPPQTFCNILMLYCKPQHAFYDLAGTVMAEHPDLVATSLSKVLLLGCCVLGMQTLSLFLLLPLFVNALLICCLCMCAYACRPAISKNHNSHNIVGMLLNFCPI